MTQIGSIPRDFRLYMSRKVGYVYHFLSQCFWVRPTGETEHESPEDTTIVLRTVRTLKGRPSNC